MESNRISIIQATENEIDLMVNMRILFSDELIGKQDAAIEAQLRLNLKEYFIEELNNTYLCYYATVNGEGASIAGLVLRKQPGSLKNPSGKWGYLMNVFTLAEYRRMGLSSQVINALMDKAISLGITSFELHATKQGELTYQKLGFEILSEPTYRKFF